MDIFRILALLETSADELKDAARAAGTRSGAHSVEPGGWNAVQCIEHVGLVEERFLGMLRTAQNADGTDSPVAPRNEENEARIHAMAASRNVKVPAPEPTHPLDRFQTVNDALAYFETARAANIRYLTEHAGKLCIPVMQHPRFGSVNGLELMCIAAGHASRHAAQIREMDAA